jgi:hypothetical protein
MSPEDSMNGFGVLLFVTVAIALIFSNGAFAQNVDDQSTYFVTYNSNNVSGAPDATVRFINEGEGAVLYHNFELVAEN